MANAIFGQELYNHLSTIVERAMGQNMDLKQMDRLRMESEKLGVVITKHVEAIAQEKALDICKKLNEATKAGFEVMEAELDALRTLAGQAKLTADQAKFLQTPIGGRNK